MGKLEQKSRRKHLQKLILKSVGATGVLGIAIIALPVVGAMAKMGLLPKARQHEYVSSSASKLVKRGLMKFENRRYYLTPEGEKILRRWELSDYKLKKPTRWDGKWRIFIFDIPEKKKGVRKIISDLFTHAGFYRLQESVWVYPYDCEGMIRLLKTDYGIGKNLLYIIGEEIESDKHLRQHFGLRL